MSKVRDDLARGIEAWLERRRNASLSVLSRLSGVSYSTIRRCVNNELGTDPSLEVVMAISRVVFLKTERQTFLAEHYPNFFDVVEEFHLSEDYATDFDPANFLLDKDCARVIALASSHGGATREAIRDLLGREGLFVAELLCKRGLLRESVDGKFETKRQNFSISDPANVISRIGLWTDFFRTENLNKPYQASYLFTTEGLNEKGLSEVAREKKRHAESMTRILTDKSLQGSKVVYTASFHNVLGENNL